MAVPKLPSSWHEDVARKYLPIEGTGLLACCKHIAVGSKFFKRRCISPKCNLVLSPFTFHCIIYLLKFKT